MLSARRLRRETVEIIAHLWWISSQSGIYSSCLLLTPLAIYTQYYLYSKQTTLGSKARAKYIYKSIFNLEREKKIPLSALLIKELTDFTLFCSVQVAFAIVKTCFVVHLPGVRELAGPRRHINLKISTYCSTDCQNLR